MARNSLAAAKAELYGILQTAGVPTVTGVTAVYSYEPAAGLAMRPVSLTIQTSGLGVDFYRIQLRLYVSPQTSVKQAQDDLDTLILRIEQKIHDSSVGAAWGRSDWSIGFDTELDNFVAATVFQVGREDLF